MFSGSDRVGGSGVVLPQIVREPRRCRPSWDPPVILPGMGRPS